MSRHSSQENAVDIAVIGHFAKDRLVVRGRTEVSPGGSVYYGTIALRRIGVSAAVITRLALEDFGLLNELREEGVLVFAQPSQETSGIENIYLTADMDRRVCKPLGFAGPFRAEDLPDIEASIFLVGPIMAGEVDLPLIREMSRRGRVALDAQGFVRVREDNELVFRDWTEKQEGLSYVEVLKVDTAEAEVLTGRTDRWEALRELAAWGPREIVLTFPEGVLVYAEGAEHQAPFTPGEVRGRTGRGDTCFATYLGRRLVAEPEEACRFAAAVTSLKMERPGPFRGSVDDVERLREVWREV